MNRKALMADIDNARDCVADLLVDAREQEARGEVTPGVDIRKLIATLRAEITFALVLYHASSQNPSP